MSRGDAILLYTDGLVESRGRDISSGIDKMIGQAERVLRGDFRNGAARLIDTLGSADDDRALLLVHRALTATRAASRRTASPRLGSVRVGVAP